MESGLTPRQIQERIRAGQSLDEVAEAAGMPHDRVERFALAVYDERRHLAEQAQGHSVRRPGETGSHRTLSTVAEEYFTRTDIDPTTVEWDATRGEDRHFWTVTASWSVDEEARVATFGYDVRGAFSVAEDDAALALIAGVPSEGSADDDEDDNEPTLNYADQFAIVNAVQSADEALEDDSATQADTDDDGNAGESFTGPFDLQDIVPTPESELDALYAMLRGHQEDSVNIYAGLAESQPPPSNRRRRRKDQVDTEAAPPDQSEPATAGAGDEAAEEAAAEPAKPHSARTGRTSAEEPEQPPLVEGEAGTDKPKPKKRPRKRAAVPSWDEIMFGGPDADQ